MVLNILSLVLILGITFLNSIYGLFSGIINLFCTLVAVAVAFGFWAPLNAFAVSQGLHPSFAAASAFLLLFLVTGVTLRVLADNFIRGNVRVPLAVDWGGGALCGFLIAELTVGVLVLGLLMLPFGERLMLYSRVARNEDSRKDASGRVVFYEHGLWLSPDSFAALVGGALSAGSLRGAASFREVYPNFPAWVSWTANTVQEESLTAPRRDEGDGFTSGIQKVEWWEQSGKLETRYRPLRPNPDNPDPNYERMEFSAGPGRRLIGVRATLAPSSADRYKYLADHRFRPSQIRIVGVRSSGGRTVPQDYIPSVIGGADPKIDDAYRLVDIDNDFSVPVEGDTPFDFIFEVDESFQPRFFEYRRFARIAMTETERLKSAPTTRLAVKKTGPAGVDQATGVARFIDSVTPNTGDEGRLPFEMRVDLLQSQSETELVDVRGEPRFAYGRLSGSRTQLESRESQRVRHFRHPGNQRIFTLETRARQAQSLAGSVFNYVGGRTNQYFAVDKSGDKYPLMGFYGVVRRENADFVEIFLIDVEDEAAVASNRAQLNFQSINLPELEQDEALLGLLFAVPRGKCIVKVETQAGQGIEFGNEYCIRTIGD
jgi:hypothetical protein